MQIRTDKSFKLGVIRTDRIIRATVRMKTLSFTVGLLLAARCCDASAHRMKTGPDECCFKFFENKIPKAQIRSIEKTDIRCPTPAFVVDTSCGEYCVRQTEQWAMAEFVRRHSNGFERPIKMIIASPQQTPNMKQVSSAGRPSLNPGGSRPESKRSNVNGSAVNPEHEDRLFVCWVCQCDRSAAT